MSLKFGTSGVRGLVSEMTDGACYRYTQAYVRHVKRSGTGSVALAGDFRGSTPRIMRAVAQAITDEGLTPDYLGYVPTPLLAHHAMAGGAGAIMVTGSHIPDDRNGIKFYMPHGEILKRDEQAIADACAALPEVAVSVTIDLGAPNPTARGNYVRRYVQGFPDGCLSGLTLVCYQHSTVGRELIPEILDALGAEVIRVGWSDSFVPVDTEAVSEPARLAKWVREHGADALVTADGDCDRPLVVDETGSVIRGDLLGIAAASFLGADSVATPVSCNTALELSGRFPRIRRTRIGSPYVIEAMQELAGEGHVVVGYEANGGFLTGSDLSLPDGQAPMTALPTRDALLPILALLTAAHHKGQTLSRYMGDLPRRFTASGLLRDFPSHKGQAIVQSYIDGGIKRINNDLSSIFGPCAFLNTTDGARMIFENGDILHVRPSGNAPELRCYAEAGSAERASEMVEWFLGSGLGGD